MLPHGIGVGRTKVFYYSKMGEEIKKTYYLFRKNQKYILIDNEDDILDDVCEASMGHEMAVMINGELIPQATFMMASDNPKIISKMRNHVRNNTLLERTTQHDESNRKINMIQMNR